MTAPMHPGSENPAAHEQETETETERTVLIGVLVIGAALSAILALLLGIAAGRKRGAAKRTVVNATKADRVRQRERRREVIQLMMALNRLLSP